MSFVRLSVVFFSRNVETIMLGSTRHLRMCVDYRALNTQTVRDRCPLPRIDDLFDRLARKCFFSKFELRSGYHPVRVCREVLEMLGTGREPECLYTGVDTIEDRS
jgi:hypothetical protein